MQRAWSPILIIFLLFAMAAAPSKGPAKPYQACQKQLEQAQRGYDALDYKSAAANLNTLSKQPNCDDMQRAEVLRLLGMTRVILGDEGGASEAFRRLLQLRPETQLDSNLSPKITKAFAKAKQQIIDAWALRIEEPIVFRWKKNQHDEDTATLELLVTLLQLQPSPALRVLLWSRDDARRAFVMSPMQANANGVYVARLPTTLDSSDPQQLEYYLRVDEPGGDVVLRAGSNEAPLQWSWTPPPPPQPSLFSQPYFWASVGGLAALSVGTAAVVMAVMMAPEPLEQSLGEYTLGE